MRGAITWTSMRVRLSLRSARCRFRVAGGAVCTRRMLSCPGRSGQSAISSGRWASRARVPCDNGATTRPPSSAGGTSTIRSFWIEHSIDEAPASPARPALIVIWAEPLHVHGLGEAEERYQQGDFLVAVELG